MKRPVRLVKAGLALVCRVPEALSDAYIEWYKRKYIPEHGDLVATTRKLFQNDSWIQAYHTGRGEELPENTPMMFLGDQEKQSPDVGGFTGHRDHYYRLLFNNREVQIPDRLIIYFKVVSRTRDAQG